METPNLATFYRNKPVLVTGGAGFIGSHIVEQLVAYGAQVTVVDNLRTGRRENLASVADAINFITRDITDYATCEAVVQGQQMVFHLAAAISVPESVHKPRDYHTINVTGTLNILEAARMHGVQRLIFSSSSAVYGEQQGICSETMTPQPQSPYALSKLMGEQYCALYAHQYGLSTVALRYFNVFGERQRADLPHAGVVATLRKKLAAHEEITLFGDGLQQRDFVPVARVVQANLIAGATTHTAKGDFFNIATGTSRTILSLLDELRQEFPTYQGAIHFTPARPGDIYYSAADCTKFKSFFGHDVC
jgi:UDP-glucose 4-epimerase